MAGTICKVCLDGKGFTARRCPGCGNRKRGSTVPRRQVDAALRRYHSARGVLLRRELDA